jgi:hypothetical protein
MVDKKWSSDRSEEIKIISGRDVRKKALCYVSGVKYIQNARSTNGDASTHNFLTTALTFLKQIQSMSYENVKRIENSMSGTGSTC